MRKISEYTIQNALYWNLLSNAQLCVPNYTPQDWWECDFLHITKAGYAVEHEIKISRSDFLADKNKAKTTFSNTEYKHDLLILRHDRCPRQFWYVTPKGLLKVDEIPEFAGLKEITVSELGSSIKVIKKAPILSNKKASQGLIDHAKSVFYYRYWNLRQEESA